MAENIENNGCSEYFFDTANCAFIIILKSRTATRLQTSATTLTAGATTNNDAQTVATIKSFFFMLSSSFSNIKLIFLQKDFTCYFLESIGKFPFSQIISLRTAHCFFNVFCHRRSFLLSRSYSRLLLIRFWREFWRWRRHLQCSVTIAGAVTGNLAESPEIRRDILCCVRGQWRWRQPRQQIQGIKNLVRLETRNANMEGVLSGNNPGSDTHSIAYASGR